MRVFYDGRIYGIQKTGGINRYFANLIARLPGDVYPVLNTDTVRELHFPTHPNLTVHQNRRYGFRPGRVSVWLGNQLAQKAVDKQKIDVAHPMYYELTTGRPIKDYRCPVVVTVYDMIHEVMPDQLEPGQEHIADLKRQAVQAAQAVICISEHTKQDLLRIYPVPEEKVHVIALASDMFQGDFAAQDIPGPPYFLYVGSRSGYKNFDIVLQTLSRMPEMAAEVCLRVVGPPWTVAEQARIAELGLAERVLLAGHVDDAHLHSLYQNSVAFIYPSLYEGFGIPLLEAMTGGTAVIGADSSSIPEVMGEAGLLFNPANADELMEKMILLLMDQSLRAALIQKGRARAALFSWDKTAAQTVSVYRSLAG